MTFRPINYHRGALIIGIALSLIACESAVITGPGSSALDIGEAQSANLLSDAGFESGFEAWTACSTAGTTNLISDASEGSQAISVNNHACLYQSIAAEAGKTYRMTCQTKQAGNNWSSATLAFLDDNNSPVVSEEKAIDSSDYANLSITLTAPANTSSTELLFYSEGSAHIDNCRLQEVSVELPAIALINESFDDGLTGWQQCQTAGSAEAVDGRATISDGSCISQIIDVSQAVALSPANQPMTLTAQCAGVSRAGSGYASLIVAFIDDNYEPVANKELAIDASTTATLMLDAPATSVYAEIMLFSDTTTTVAGCTVSN